MAACCGVPRCSCRVIAGPGVTVDGNGSAAAPYVISSDSTATPVQAGDTQTVDTTVSGTGVAGDPWIVSADVIVDPTPPGGGSNLLEAGPDGLFVECADVRTCFTAGDGIAYDEATGEIAAQLSADAGNTTVYGTDGGLYTPAGGGGEPTALGVTDSPTLDLTVSGTGTAVDPYDITGTVIVDPAPPGGDNLLQAGPGGLFVLPADLSVVGCGLTGDGTAAAPITANPIAGEAEWSATWACADEMYSTLKCDPTTGGLWTPPEHSSASVSQQQSHFTGTFTQGVTGWIIIDPVVWSEGTYTAGSLTTCRGVSFQTTFTGHAEVSWLANATFELGYAVSVNGGAATVRRMNSQLTGIAAGQRLHSFTTHYATVYAPMVGGSVRVFPAIRVVAGSVTIQSWITETLLAVQTR